MTCDLSETAPARTGLMVSRAAGQTVRIGKTSVVTVEEIQPGKQVLLRFVGDTSGLTCLLKPGGVMSIDDATITVAKIRGCSQVRLRILSPESTRVLRGELVEGSQ